MPFILLGIVSLFLIVFPPKAHAIVVLPAILLIPLVKLIAFVVGIFSVPIGSGGMILAKITRNYKLVFLVSILLLLLIGVTAAIILRLTHPNNPWF